MTVQFDELNLTEKRYSKFLRSRWLVTTAVTNYKSKKYSLYREWRSASCAQTNWKGNTKASKCKPVNCNTSDWKDEQCYMIPAILIMYQINNEGRCWRWVRKLHEEVDSAESSWFRPRQRNKSIIKECGTRFLYVVYFHCKPLLVILPWAYVGSVAPQSLIQCYNPVASVSLIQI